MKKIYLFLACVIAVFTGCSSDSEGSPNRMLKEVQTETVSADFTSNIVFKFTYTGNKIKSIKSGSSYETKYAYTGDLITSVSNYNDEVLMFKAIYGYDNFGNMVRSTATEYQEGASELNTYTYNPGNTITRLTYSGTTETPANLTKTSTISLDVMGRFIGLEDYEGTGWIIKIMASYTNYNSPLRNIVGYEKLLSFNDVRNCFATYDQLNNTPGNGFNNTSVFNYTVDSANYPIQCVQTLINTADGSTSVTTSNYIYY
jgi:hypothetical protein